MGTKKKSFPWYGVSERRFGIYAQMYVSMEVFMIIDGFHEKLGTEYWFWCSRTAQPIPVSADPTFELDQFAGMKVSLWYLKYSYIEFSTTTEGRHISLKFQLFPLL